MQYAKKVYDKVTAKKIEKEKDLDSGSADQTENEVSRNDLKVGSTGILSIGFVVCISRRDVIANEEGTFYFCLIVLFLGFVFCNFFFFFFIPGNRRGRLMIQKQSSSGLKSVLLPPEPQPHIVFREPIVQINM